MNRRLVCVAVLYAIGTAHAADTCKVPRPQGLNVPPEGFTALFNGKDLGGWRGLGHTDPYEIAKWSEQERKEKQAAADADMRQHWKVENGEIVNDGHGVFLTTEKDYRDFELIVDWKMTPKTDSGIYLRGCPQVQIWDSNNEVNDKTGIQKGSGALWNNNGQGKWPKVKADHEPGEWNTFYIKMVGERVTVVFNGKLTVDNAVMENFWNREKPVPATGPIQLQTHGGEMRFRNVFIREIPTEEANKILQARNDEGFIDIFNGNDLTGWVGAVNSYEVIDGAIACKQGGGGTLFYEKPLADFAVRFEFKLPPAGNNGLAIRAPLEGNPAYDGMEIQILDDGHEKYAKLEPWQAHGSIYGLAAAERGYLRPTGEWNYEEIIAKGPHVQVFVNGTRVLDVKDVTKLESEHHRDIPGRLRTEGHIGLFGHSDPVRFRNIRVKPM